LSANSSVAALKIAERLYVSALLLAAVSTLPLAVVLTLLLAAVLPMSVISASRVLSLLGSKAYSTD
jgi:hypothetical protein